MLLVVLVLAAAPAPKEYELPVTRDGKTITRVSQNFWPGEYPGPVVNVAKETTVKAFASVRDLSGEADCTIKPGIYHTWAKKQGSAIGYFNLLPVRTYSVTADTTVDVMPIKAGSTITDVVPLSEGTCRAQIVEGKKKKVIETNCDTLDSAVGVKLVAGDGDSFNEQWIQLQCNQGHKAFIIDKALLKAPGAKPGEIKSYGEVGP